MSVYILLRNEPYDVPTQVLGQPSHCPYREPAHRAPETAMSMLISMRFRNNDSQKVKLMIMFAALKCASMSHEVFGKNAEGVP